MMGLIVAGRCYLEDGVVKELMEVGEGWRTILPTGPPTGPPTPPDVVLGRKIQRGPRYSARISSAFL